MQVLLQLTNIPPGSSVGPTFNIITLPPAVAVPSLVNLTQITNGIIVTVPDTTTDVGIQSNGVCETSALAEVPCTNPLEKIFTDYFNSTQNPTPQGFGTFINTGNASVVNDCIICPTGCNRYVLSSVETYLKYAEAVGLTQSAAVPA